MQINANHQVKKEWKTWDESGGDQANVRFLRPYGTSIRM